MMKRKALQLMLLVVLVFSITTVALGAEQRFSANLPRNQGDIEVSTVRKATSEDTFMINMYSIGTGITTVCVWTEKDALIKRNYSSPYFQVGVGRTDGDYDILQPAVGDNVILNLDNPVVMSTTVSVSGIWSPN